MLFIKLCDFRVDKLVLVDDPSLPNSSTLSYIRYAELKVLSFTGLWARKTWSCGELKGS